MRIAVSVESTSDLPKELLEKFNIHSVPFHITLGDKTFKDGELSTEEMFAFVDKHDMLPKTNAINEFEYTEYFENLKKEYDAVVHVSLSSDLSSSCGNAIRASQNLENVFVVDSRTLSSGIALLALHACELVEKGMEAAAIADELNKKTANVQASFVLKRLDFLYKGGRCNALSYFGANLLKIRPRIVVKDGKMGSDKKYRGNMGKVVAKYCQDVFADNQNPDLSKAFLTYTTASEDMIAEAKLALVERGFKQIYEAHAGGTIASHCGANTLGILFFNE